MYNWEGEAGEIRQGNSTEIGQAGNVRVAIGWAATFEKQNASVLGESGR